MRIIIAGGSGLIGKELAKELAYAGHMVFILSRSNMKSDIDENNIRIVKWDGKSTIGWLDLVDGSDVIVNLAGENIAGSGFLPKRWTRKRRRMIRDSRINAGNAIVSAVTSAKNKPLSVIQASAIGYYGSRDDMAIDELTGAGKDFLAHLCQEWEESTHEVQNYGVRQVIIRTGVVLSNNGGALGRIMLPYKYFVGGPFGNGHQVMSWIHIADEVGAIRFLIENPKSSGVYNLVAPNPITNAELGRKLGELLHRPSWIPVPGIAMKVLFGEVASVVLDGQRVMPKRLLESGYLFKYSAIEESLKNLLNI